MPTVLTKVRPTSLAQIRQTFTNWFEQHHRGHKPQFRFFRSLHSDETLRMWTRPERDVRLRLHNKALSCEFSKRWKFQLTLDDFDVKAEWEGKLFVFEFKASKGTRDWFEKKISAIENAKNRVFVTRALNAVNDLAEDLPDSRIEEASAAPTDYMVLVKALSAPSLSRQLAESDPLAAARLRGAQRQQQLLREAGGALRAEEVAGFLGISRQAVDKRRRQGRLIGLTQGRRGYAYPAWQFENGKTVVGLEKVLDRLRDHDPWMQLVFFLNGNDRLNGSRPLDLLREGREEAVFAAAASYGEQGAA